MCFHQQRPFLRLLSGCEARGRSQRKGRGGRGGPAARAWGGERVPLQGLPRGPPCPGPSSRSQASGAPCRIVCERARFLPYAGGGGRLAGQGRWPSPTVTTERRRRGTHGAWGALAPSPRWPRAALQVRNGPRATESHLFTAQVNMHLAGATAVTQGFVLFLGARVIFTVRSAGTPWRAMQNFRVFKVKRETWNL